MTSSSLKTEKGQEELDKLLATKAFIGSEGQPTQEDFDRLGELHGAIDMTRFPNLYRWQTHLRHLQVKFPLRNWKAFAAKGGNIPGRQTGGNQQGGKANEGGKSKDQAQLEGKLPNAEMGKVCTRFPPEPSGYLHIGHAKAAMLNNYYARAFKGKMIVRFDDTNPSKEKAEFEESIIQDLATLGIKPDVVSHTSDHFEKLQDMMEKVIKNGDAYIDDTPMEQMRAERDAGTESKCRSQTVEENLELWKEVLKGSERGQQCCVRGKIDMQEKNKCLRDPVFYRCKVDTPHHKTGTKYKAYPTYDFACPCVDSLEGVTHALRTIEYKDRDAMYEWVTNKTKSRKIELVEFSKTQFAYTILSKRKLQFFVDEGVVAGWNDPRMPTVQGVMRRGMTVEGLLDFVMTQGASKSTNLMEWDKIWAINKQKIDPIVPRYAAVDKENHVKLKLTDGPAEPYGELHDRHPKNPDLGQRLILFGKEALLEPEDAQEIGDGEEITLLHWGNIVVDKVEKDKAGKVSGLTGHLNLKGDVKSTKKKVHWVANVPQNTELILQEFDHVVTKPKLEDDDELKDIINPSSKFETKAVGDPLLKTLQKGDKIQLERRGYYIIDSIAFPPGEPVVLVKIPDGKASNMSIISTKVDASKLQGGGDSKKEKGGKEKGKADAKAEAKGSPKAEAKAEPAKGDAKKDGKAKAKAKGGDKPADRPVEDITRLEIRVGEIKKVWEHPEADKLYCEEIDLGEGQNRTIASGLREHVKKDDMLSKCVVLANLKPRTMKGFVSQGMVLCVTNKDGKVELLKPPAGAKVGERVTIEGFEMLDADEKLNEKSGKAPLEAVKADMRTTAKCVAAYKGAAWLTSAGPVTCNTGDGQIS